MKKIYSTPKMTLIEIEELSILCTSSPNRDQIASQRPSNSNVVASYSYLTQRQKLAALNLMAVFGGSCPGTSENISKINHIMTAEGNKMGISGAQRNASWDTFAGMPDMVNTLKGANREALKELFWAYYCIVAVGQSTEAVQVLLGIYEQLGITNQECISILEKRTGIKVEKL